MKESLDDLGFESNAFETLEADFDALARERGGRIDAGEFDLHDRSLNGAHGKLGLTAPNVARPCLGRHRAVCPGARAVKRALLL